MGWVVIPPTISTWLYASKQPPGCFPKWWVFPPNHPLKDRVFGFSILFTIHFGGKSPYFWVNPHLGYIKIIPTPSPKAPEQSLEVPPARVRPNNRISKRNVDPFWGVLWDVPKSWCVFQVSIGLSQFQWCLMCFFVKGFSLVVNLIDIWCWHLFLFGGS